MTDDHLSELLRQADRDAKRTDAEPVDLAGLVRQRARRRTFVRVGTAVVAALALTGGAIGVLSTDSVTRPKGQFIPVVSDHPSSDQTARLRAEIARLEARADVSLRVVRELKKYRAGRRRLDRLKKQLAVPDPYARIAQRIERAAFLSIREAERLRRDGNRPAAAAAAYRRVIQLFPQTRWAKVAEQKLNEIEMPNGEVL